MRVVENCRASHLSPEKTRVSISGPQFGSCVGTAPISTFHVAEVVSGTSFGALAGAMQPGLKPLSGLGLLILDGFCCPWLSADRSPHRSLHFGIAAAFTVPWLVQDPAEVLSPTKVCFRRGQKRIHTPVVFVSGSSLQP